MKSKEEIVQNWLPRYTGTPLNEFGKYILLTNFSKYVKMFAELNNVKINGLDMPMPNATAHGITIINFGMGSANAATIMDLLSSIEPKAVLFLGKCGGLKKRIRKAGGGRKSIIEKDSGTLTRANFIVLLSSSSSSMARFSERFDINGKGWPVSKARGVSTEV